MVSTLIVLLLLVAVITGLVLVYVLSQQAFRRSLSEVQDYTARQIAVLSDALHGLEIEIAQLRKAAPAQSVAPPAPSPAAPAITTATKPEPKAQEVAPDTLVLLAAAVTAFLGKKVRIRSAKMLQSPYEIVNPWAQQGRVIVQASHNLRPRG